MFTGIVQAVGRLGAVSSLEDGRRFRVEASTGMLRELDKGASVAVSGVCLTVTDFDGEDGFRTDVSGETLSKTTLSEYEPGDRVNLEPSLKVGDELGGHFVFGHVDATVEITTLEERGDFYELGVRLPDEYQPYVAPKGSVALDGISLTVNRVDGNEISLRIIPHTYQNTRIKALEPGKDMNFEVDMLARYVYTSLRNTRSDDAEVPADITDVSDFPRHGTNQ
jgi:riboflavin synthase